MPPSAGETPLDPSLPPSTVTEEPTALDRAIATRDAEAKAQELGAEALGKTLAARERTMVDLMKAASQLTPEQIGEDIIANKELRRDLDAQLQKLKGLRGSRHRSLAITHLEDVIMRLGMDLQRLNELSPTPEPRPYPSSYDPSNTKVEPTADGLKL